MTGRQRALDRKPLSQQPHRLAAQPRPHQLDQLLGQMRDVADRLVFDLAGLAIRAAQQMTDILAALPLPPIGDNVNRTGRAWSARHDQTLHAPSDSHTTLLLTTKHTNEKTET